ncbi:MULTISPECIES: ATP-dependent Clp protease proteolytic subunit [unclassified Streptomyces]|uniref:ATP-dependent Clp protease proteolytic subunit n=1 Tax=unclassified Streptomyces TaxID=2593676 RepID=UPI001D03B156|nr:MULTISPECIES: ATP-dependent Clp protease proteolytic subunit [unclassified Streptomyces]
MTAVHDVMQTLTCDVAAFCVGRAASTAAALLAAGAPGKRHALPGARVVLRQPSLEGPLRGRPVDLDAHARELLRRREQMAGLLAWHTGREPDRVRADLARDLVLDATGAQAHGIVDEVLAARGEADR